ncbi:unnamed protein product [Coffea canephora]|uniref:DH200=94 genomic scaffold, scaffold_191 n=1 Tax=Coffea canephora TaxID=49390 RepID=A0A068VBH8_COFCA|nr:unnamed protein product [Coffea canephora]
MSGIATPTAAFRSGELKFGCLARVLDTGLPPDASDAECRQRARIYLLLILAGHLLSNKSGNKVPLLYLPLLRDLETVGQYSWGSACLATLYRSLCNATNPTKSAIAGLLVLLQEHIPTMRPDRIASLEHYPDPYGVRCAFRPYFDCSYFIKYKWNNDLDIHSVVRHVVPAFRDQLIGLRPEEFIWQPYLEDVLASLPAYCTAGQDIWRSVTYLICWDVVEPHLAHRVMRQFGFHQSLPDMRLTDNQAALHSLDRRDRANQDWSTTHR